MALEQSFGNADVQTLTYLAAAGRKLMRLDIYNQPNPSFTGESDLMTNGADSSYNALRVQCCRRFTHALQALAPYTWAHSIDDASSDVYFLHVPPTNAAASQERGSVKTFDYVLAWSLRTPPKGFATWSALPDSRPRIMSCSSRPRARDSAGVVEVPLAFGAKRKPIP